jgi:hypothetical protein
MARTSQLDRILSFDRAATADFAIRPAPAHIQQQFSFLNFWFRAPVGHSPSSWLSRVFVGLRDRLTGDHESLRTSGGLTGALGEQG